ncbi:MAG: RNA-guided endonuclease InsQ/TnpB family protein [Sarcina sp.]
MIKAIKIRLLPTIEQENQMWKSAGTKRFIYNWTLSRQEENYRNGGKFISDNDLRKEITQLKKTELAWLKEVSNNVAKQAVKDACNAYKRFFKGLADKLKFKSRRKSRISFYNDNIALEVKKDSILIEKVGWVKLSKINSIPIGVKYTKPTVSYDNKYWFISIGIEQGLNDVKLTGESIGVDLGIKDLAIVSNIEKPFKNINKTKKVKNLERRKKRFQRKLSRKYNMLKVGKVFEKGQRLIKTQNIIKLEKQSKLIDRKLANIRLNHIHQTTNEIVKTKPSRIVVEDLNVKGMMKNRHLSKAIQNQCLYEFKRQLKYKAKFNKIEFIEADRFFPSNKMCSCCGTIKKDLKLKDRTYVCINDKCNLVMDRDKNASFNLARYKLA